MRRPDSRSDAMRGPLGRLRPFASGIALLAVALIASGSIASGPRAPRASAATGDPDRAQRGGQEVVRRMPSSACSSTGASTRSWARASG